MATQFVTSVDGARIAYDVTGSGPALMLLAGSNQTRQVWHAAGYVARWQASWQAITVDVRGSGESEFLTGVDDFTVDKFCADLSAVADACDARQLAVLGYSFGGGIAPYLAARDPRVTALAILGTPLFGPSVDEESGRFVDQFLQKYGAMTDAYHAGTLSQEEQAAAVQRRIPMWVARFKALRAWPRINRADVRCPTLLVVGTRNEQVYRRISGDPELSAAANVQVEIIDGLDHEQEFSNVERVYPLINAFFQRHWIHASS
jgi:pimeloyl-ACP methyl ester carboxylesterase